MERASSVLPVPCQFSDVAMFERYAATRSEELFAQLHTTINAIVASGSLRITYAA